MTNTETSRSAIAAHVQALLKFSRPVGSLINAQIALDVNHADRDLADEFVANIADTLSVGSVEITGQFQDDYRPHQVRLFVTLTRVTKDEEIAVEGAARTAGWFRTRD
jgi:hypothetical protein